MSEKHLHITRNETVSREMLLAYLRDELSPEAKAHFESLMREDAFLRDAVEGLKSADPAGIEKSLHTIYAGVDKATGSQKPFILSPAIQKYAAAASLVIFAAVSIIVILQLNKPGENNSSPVLAKQELAKPETSEMNISDTGMGAGSLSSDSIVADVIAMEKKNVITEINQGTSIASFSLEEKKYSVSATLDEIAVVQNDAEIAASEINTGDNANDLAIVMDAEKTETVAAEKSAVNDDYVVTKELADVSVQKKDNGIFRNDKKTKTMGNEKDKEEELASPTVAGAVDTYASKGEDAVYAVAEVMPSFPGGMDSLNAFITQTIRYPKNTDAQGTVYVKFIVRADGSISDAVVLKGIEKNLDAEALRVVDLMPAWNPGMQGNKAVDVYYTMAVKFSLK